MEASVSAWGFLRKLSWDDALLVAGVLVSAWLIGTVIRWMVRRLAERAPAPDLGGQVDVTSTTDTTTSKTTLVGSADVTSPETITTSTSTELDSSLAGGGDDASVESDSNAAAVGDSTDDCRVAGLISCPSFP